MGNFSQKLRYITKSKFMRSILIQTVAIFLLFSVAITLIVFSSFVSEMNSNLIAERDRQLSVIESTISTRMAEIGSIAYNIGVDASFYIEPVEGERYSGREMSDTLARYLVGNSFIQYLAYYRSSEPDIIYTSKGEMLFRDFWTGYLGVEAEAAESYIKHIKEARTAELVSFSFKGSTYFAYLYPLPVFSQSPQAFVLAMIPDTKVAPLLSTQLVNHSGVIAVFNSSGQELYRIRTLDEGVDVEASLTAQGSEESYIKADGKDYVVQRYISASNGWSYVSIIRLNDLISGLAAKQLVFVLLLVMLMVAAVLVMLYGILNQYSPIRELADSITNNAPNGMVDEQAVLSSTLAALRDDSSQKQKFETAYHEAEAANKAKSAFLSSMSHDIRTPMNAIVGMTAIAERHLNDPQFVGECLHKVSVASEYLLDIINNVLDMSRIESGRFTISQEPIELSKLIVSIMTILCPTVRTKGLRLVAVTENVTHENVLGDNVRIMQVLMNILSNAVKFTPEGGEIRLKIKQFGTHDGYGDYEFTVADTGIGMSPEFVAQVFDTFSREHDSGARKTEGTGLGMAIAKNLLTLMGGTIQCESTQNVGTTFTVKLPLKLSGNEKTLSIAQKSSVLIYGEESDQRASTARVFSELDADVCEAEFPSAALSLLSERGFSLAIILSAGSHNADIAAVSAIHSAGGGSVRIALCGNDISELNQSALKEAGVDLFASLPFFRSTAILLLEGRLTGSPDESDNTDADLSGLNVLIAEDNELNLEIATQILLEAGANIVQAINGEQAVARYCESPENYFDVILMDLQMPVMNGYEATAEIRASDRADRLLPIYALTASTFDEDVRQVRESHMDGHIGKPYTPNELYRVLSALKRK